MGRKIAALARLQTVVVRLGGSVLQLLLSLALAHTYGAAELGRFLVFVAVTSIVGAIGGGLPTVLMRYASVARGDGRDHHVGWLWRHSLTLAATCLVGSAAGALLGSAFLRDLGVAVAAMLVQRASSAALKARRRANLGILLDAVLYPFVILVFVLAVRAAGWTDVTGSLRLAYIGALVGAAVIGVALGWRHPGSIRTSWSAPRRTPREVYAEIIRVTSGAAATTLSTNAPMAVAPLFLAVEDVGSLGLALRVAGFATTLLMSLNAYYGPAFARARSAEELRGLRTQARWAGVVLYVPVVAGFLAFPSAWLEAVDPALGSVKMLVAVLSVGYLVNAAMGMSSSLLVMRGHSRTYSRLSARWAGATVVSVVAGGALGGAVGLAAAKSSMMSIASLVFSRAATRMIDSEVGPLPDRRGEAPARASVTE